MLNSLLFTLLFGSYYLHSHSYFMLRPEALLFFALIFLSLLAVFHVLRSLKCRWLFDSLLLILAADLSFGIFHATYIFFKNVGGGKPAGYLSIAALFFLLIGIGGLIRNKIRSIAGVLLLTTLVSTVVTYPFTSKPFIKIVKNATPTEALRKPNVFFIILDEHIGLEGIPSVSEKARRLKKSLMERYAQDGFRLFSRAYSNSGLTGNSIPGILNSRIISNRKGEFENGVLRHNRLLEKLQAEGYRLFIYQSNFMDFTHSANVVVEKSMTYDIYSMGLLQAAPIPILNKTLILTSNFVEWYHSQSLKEIFYTLLKHRWSLLSPFAVEPVVHEMEKDLLSHPEGTVFFAHLLAPHFPYIYGDDGRIINPFLWETDDCFGCPKEVRNTPELREKKYVLYLNQVEWLQKTLQPLLRQHGTFVILSDHGSRISLNAMHGDTADRLTTQDYVDTYSAFVAVKKNGAGIVDKQQTVLRIVAEIFSLESPQRLQDMEFSKIYLPLDEESEDASEKEVVAKEMPAF